MDVYHDSESTGNSDDNTADSGTSLVLDSFTREGSQPPSPRSSAGIELHPQRRYSSDFSSVSSPHQHSSQTSPHSTSARESSFTSTSTYHAESESDQSSAQDTARSISLAALQDSFDRSLSLGTKSSAQSPPAVPNVVPPSSAPASQMKPHKEEAQIRNSLASKKHTPSTSETSVFERLAQNKRCLCKETPCDVAQCHSSTRQSRQRNGSSPKYWQDPRVEPPHITDTMTVWELVQLAQATAHLTDLDRSDIGALATYLEMMCFVHNPDHSEDSVVQSVEAHLNGVSIASKLRDIQRMETAAVLDATIAFSYVNWMAVVKELGIIEMDPPMERLTFITRWLPGSEAPDPFYDVHTWVSKLKHHIALIRGDCLRRCLAASISTSLGGRKYPPLYLESPLLQWHRALLAEALRLLRAPSSQAKFLSWCRSADATSQANALEHAHLLQQKQLEDQQEQEEVEAKEEERKARFESWCRAKEEEARIMAEEKAKQRELAKLRQQEKETAKRNAEAQYAQWLKRVNQESKAKQSKASSDQAAESQARQAAIHEASEQAFQLWLQRVDAERLEKQRAKHEEAQRRCAKESEKFKRSQRNFKRWLKLKSQQRRVAPARCLRRLPWVSSSEPGGGLFLLDEQRYDYLF